MLLGFILGLFAGAILMCIVQINKINEYKKSIEEIIKTSKKEDPEFYCMDDTETNKHIPTIN